MKANDKVYFGKYGTYDVPWYVLSAGSGSAFLLSEYLLGDSQFRASNSGYYKDNTLNAKMDEFYNVGTNTLFTTTERGAIASKTNLSCVDGPNDDTNSPAVPTAYLYPLSYNEANAQGGWGSNVLQAKYRDTGSAGWWWLRSSRDGSGAFCVDASGGGSYFPVIDNLGVRPAFNLDLSSVLFTSAAEGSKLSGAEGADALKQNVIPSGRTDWKLTLKDSSRDRFAIRYLSSTSTSATFRYANAKTGANEYLSAVIVDDTDNVLYYGRIKSLPDYSDDSADVTINIPAGVTLGANATLKVFNEQFNGDKVSGDSTSRAYTDYASPLRTVDVPVPSAIISSATVSGTRGTAIPDSAPNVTITLSRATLLRLPQDTIVTNWFTNIPAGMSAHTHTSITDGATAITVYFSGTPTAESTAAMAVTLPADALQSGSALTVTANPDAKWAIAAPTPAPAITSPSSPQTAPAAIGSPATLSVAATNAASYQWRINRNDGNGFVDIPDATNASYTTSPVTSADNGYQYVCVVTGSGGSVTSPVFTLNVLPPSATASASVPTTGDGAMPLLWLGLTLLCGAGLSLSAARKRGKRREG